MAGWFNPLDPNAGAQSLLTQEEIETRRKIAAQMAAAATKSRPMTHWAQAAAQGLEGFVAGLEQRKVDQASAASADYDKAQQASWGASPVAPVTAAPVVTGEATPAVAPAGGTTVAAGAALDPVASDLAPHQKAFLNAVAGPESAGRYNVRYTPSGGATFEGFDKHPAIYEKGPAGPSSAAGRYQFVKSTWDALGGGDFSPENQDRRAWQLGQQDYKRNTGRDLDSDLKANGFTPQIAQALAPTWAGFKDNPGKAVRAYQSSIQRYGQQPTQMADLPSSEASPVGLPGTGQGFAIPPAAVQPVEGDDPAKLRADAEYYAKTNPEAARQMLARADAAEAASVPAVPQAPPMPMPAATQPAPPMNGNTFNAIQAGGMEPVFQSEGVSQPWMNTAIPPAASPAARVAQAMQSAPMPPPRPSNLGAAPSVPPEAAWASGTGGLMPQAAAALPDLSNTPDGGARILQVLSEQQRQGQSPAPGMPMPAPTAAMPVAQASLPGAAPAASPAPAQRVAQAVAAAQGGAPAAAAPAASPAAQRIAALLPGVDPAVARSAFDPKVSPATRQLAGLIVQQQLAAAKREDPLTVEGRKLDVELKRKQLTGNPDEAEGRRLENDIKRKQLGKPADAPTTKVIKQADGSEVAVQWDAPNQAWVPLVAPQGGNAVGGSPSNPYALPGKPTEDQGKSAGFANRMVESHNIIGSLEAVGTDKTQAALGSVPLFGNALSSGDKQKFEQAKRNFVTAVLRPESGAVISPSEFETEEKKYFPMVGDRPEVVEQKRAARETAIQSVMARAGSGYKVPEGFKPGKKTEAPAIDTSKPGSFKWNPATGKMEPA